MSAHPDYDKEVETLLESHLFSPAFYRLCTGLSDFDGLVAYGIYKDHKRRALIEKPMRRNDASFHKIHHNLNDGQRDTLCKDAQQRLKIYADKVIEDATPRIQRDYAKAHIAKSGRGQFWKGVGASLTASFLMLLFFEMAPWFAEQSPSHLADRVDQTLKKIETAIAKRMDPLASPDQIEPAAAPKSPVHDSPVVADECLLLQPPFIDPNCSEMP